METRIAIIQEGPEYFNLPKSIEKAKQLIGEAKMGGANIIAFGECWLTGYPAWLDYCRDVALWDHDPVKEAWGKMYSNAVEIPGPAVQSIQNLAKEHNCFVVLGANEVVKKGKGNGSLYNTVLIIDDKGTIRNHHRKLIPTFTERLVHGLGDGAGLQAVESPHGRLGALICWEHWMPLTRQAMHDEAEDIHFALWPYVKPMHQIASRQYAFEGRCYVVSVGQLMQARDTPAGLNLPDDLRKNPGQYVLQGGSCVIGPDGEYVLEPSDSKERIIWIDIPDINMTIKEKMNLAVSGHYQRHDVFSFKINKTRQTD